VGQGSDLTKPSSFYSIQSAYPAIGSYYGILSGAGFSISYALFGLLWGQATDKYSRKWIITMAAIGWSLTSIFTG